MTRQEKNCKKRVRTGLCTGLLGKTPDMNLYRETLFLHFLFYTVPFSKYEYNFKGST